MREDLGMIPLVTPTSQIVGTQAVINVLSGSRYSTITRESAGVLRGEYGASPASTNAALQQRALDGDELITDRPADHLPPELDAQTAALRDLAQREGFALAGSTGGEDVDDVLTYALFPQVGTKFLANRGNPDAFEPVPGPTPVTAAVKTPMTSQDTAHYTISVDGHAYQVVVAEGDVTLAPSVAVAAPEPSSSGSVSNPSAATHITAGLAGTIHQVLVNVGDVVSEGQVVCILEAMKMETEVRAVSAGTVSTIGISVGDSVTVGQSLMSLG